MPLLLLAALDCGPQLTREERIERLRSQYSAELKSLTVKQDPLAAPAPDGTVAGGGAAPAVRTDAILDILVSTTGQERLDGLTLDVHHVDADRREKDRRTLWVDTAGVARAGGTQVTTVLENVPWETGDGFLVEVRTPVPAADRAAYREFETE